MQFEVRNRFSGAVQFTAEIDCTDDTPISVKLGLAVRWAVKSRADLSDANLYRANLSSANLSSADLSGANLSHANLYRANLSSADLSDANLSDADLSDANLYRANLSSANLSSADLSDANLSDANLYRANLSSANLSSADLSGANLSHANLSRADHVADRVIDGGLRSDGYRFLLTRTEPGPWKIKAGCRNFTVDEAAAHWSRTRPTGGAIGDETRLIIAHMLALANLRQWPASGEEHKQEETA